MKQTGKAQSGSIMIEVVAVLGILAVLGPVLYRQVVQRNRELANINVASEMRTMKEAFSSFIQTQHRQLEELAAAGGGACTLTGRETANCSYTNLWKNVATYLPMTYNTYTGDTLTGSTAEKYNFYLFGKNVYNVAGSQVGTSFYGVVLPKASALPTGTWNLKRAASIAALIGADGGIVQGDNFVGTMGTWELEGAALTMEPMVSPSYVAFTGYDDGSLFSSLEDEATFKNLHAWSYFSVGEGNTNCFTKDSGGYTVLEAGGDCAPLFWVGAEHLENGTDEGLAGTPGNVYIRNDLHVGRQAITMDDPVHDGQTIQAFVSTAVVSTDPADNEKRSIVVYDVAGKRRVTVNANGQIITRDSAGRDVLKAEAEEATDGSSMGKVTANAYDAQGHLVENAVLSAKGIDSSVEFVDEQAANESATYDHYKVDPAYTSVMNDVKLASRGGARLSDILPNYISKSMTELTRAANLDSCSGGTNNCLKATVSAPECPAGYKAALVVTPVRTTGKDVLNSFEGTSDGNTVTVTGANMTRYTVAVAVNGAHVSTTEEETVSGNGWSVEVGYVSGPGATNFTGGALGENTLSARVETFCVFDESNFTLPEVTRD